MGLYALSVSSSRSSKSKSKGSFLVILLPPKLGKSLRAVKDEEGASGYCLSASFLSDFLDLESFFFPEDFFFLSDLSFAGLYSVTGRSSW